ncbi:MAG: FAD-dependent oxidoreductase, partial [Proteobacteria bacterium]|nr:FAD-dependent oxidoreductase [Pseudomonadota bacterium]
MKDFVIIGGGFAGLSAGYHLSHAGKTFVLLEARERLGGRTETVTLQDGSAVDLGGQWIGPGHDRIYRLSKELQVAIFPTFNEGKHFFEDDAKKHIFAGPVPKLDFWSLRKLTRAMAKLDQLASEINILHPWLSSNARTLDSQTLQTWLDVNLTNEPAKRVLSTALMQLLAIEPNRVSLLHLLFYIRSGKNLTYLVSMAGGAQQDRFVAGTEALANKLAEGFRESIRLASPVLSIQQDADGVTAITAS